METDSRVHFAGSLAILIALTGIGATVGQSEADRIRMEDPCAMELQLETRSDNLACVARIERIDQSPITEFRCFNFAEICNGQQFCTNGADEGLDQDSPPRIVCNGEYLII